MYRLTDSELISELQDRLEVNKRALHDLRVMTQKLSEVNRKLQDAEQLKSHFLSNIRNEIVNPLTSIMALASQVTMLYPKEDPLLKIGNMIHSEAFSLDMQLRNIFTAAEIEAGELEQGVSRVDVTSLVGEAVKSFAHMAAAKRIEIAVSSVAQGQEESRIIFATDAEKFQTIVLNLLSNGIEFSRRDSKVEVAIKKDDATLSLSVKDFGPGIPEAERGRIFDRFKQAEEGTRKSHRGHGLGLSITKSLAEFLNGTIGFTTAIGKGTTFLLTVPEAAASEGVDVFSEDGNEFIFEGDEEVL
jgi:signal transduction histidine kinase